MKHSDKDIEAANYWMMSEIQPTYPNAFLAGCEHKQKDIDELVEGLERIMDMPETIGHAYRMKKIAKELIQKYKR